MKAQVRSYRLVHGVGIEELHEHMRGVVMLLHDLNLAAPLVDLPRHRHNRHRPEPPTLKSPLFLGRSPPNLAHLTPFFARSLRLGARKPETAKER